MLTINDLHLLHEFLALPEAFSNLYGAATLPDNKGVLILNNRGEKPIDYFLTVGDLDCPTINGIPFTDYTDIILTKKNRDSGITQTIVLPLNKNL